MPQTENPFPVLPEQQESSYQYAVTVDDTLEASHQLHLPYESKCNNLHGHTYHVRVKIAATALDNNGMVVDFVHVKGVLRRYDHRHLNDFFTPTTAEKFAEVLLDELQTCVRTHNPASFVVEVGVSETRSTWAVAAFRGI